jgi:hypothetical protein
MAPGQLKDLQTLPLNFWWFHDVHVIFLVKTMWRWLGLATEQVQVLGDYDSSISWKLAPTFVGTPSIAHRLCGSKPDSQCYSASRAVTCHLSPIAQRKAARYHLGDLLSFCVETQFSPRVFALLQDAFCTEMFLVHGCCCRHLIGPHGYLAGVHNNFPVAKKSKSQPESHWKPMGPKLS